MAKAGHCTPVRLTPFMKKNPLSRPCVVSSSFSGYFQNLLCRFLALKLSRFLDFKLCSFWDF